MVKSSSTAVEKDALFVYLLYMADHAWFSIDQNLGQRFEWALAKRSENGGHFNAEIGTGEHW